MGAIGQEELHVTQHQRRDDCGNSLQPEQERCCE
jgi:hypothetical protein